MSDEADGSDLDGTITWRALLAETKSRLEQSGASDNPTREARWIVEEVTGAEGEEFTEVLDSLATTRGVAKLDALVGRRNSGEPIQYVLGHWPFRTVDLLVDQRVLIPRPETEVVAGLALDEFDRVCPSGAGIAVDMGTGSGALGLSIAVERPHAQVVLTDSSADAIAVARANLAGLGRAARTVEIAEGSWFDALPDRYRGVCDVIVSNPPYIGADEHLPDSVANWEPRSALLAGDDGLADLLHIVEQVSTWLKPTGSVVLEMASPQTAIVASHGERHGFSTSIHSDLAGLSRVVVMRRGE